MNYRFEWYTSLKDIPIDSDTWNSLTHKVPHPFFSYSWLFSLEDSGSICPNTGWQPYHLMVWSDTTPISAAVLYIRNTSVGEIFFDFNWAQAAEQFDLPYYPKLVGTIPATPVQGYQFLMNPDLNEREQKSIIINMLIIIQQKTWKLNLAQVAFLFLDESFAEIVKNQGFYIWGHHKFQWTNNNYGNFEDFQSTFKKNQRRNIKRERIAARDLGIHILPIRGNGATETDWKMMYEYYTKTNDQFGPYAARFLNRSFFLSLAASAPDYIILLKAIKDGQTIGMSFLGYGRDSLFGRYWGSDTQEGFLHFNLCYYAPQEFAIQNKCAFFDPGVGSFHKMRRGFQSRVVYSAHLFSDQRMNQLWSDNIPRMNEQLLAEIKILNSQMPQIESKN